jgi:predicted phosphodiesterase
MLDALLQLLTQRRQHETDPIGLASPGPSPQQRPVSAFRYDMTRKSAVLLLIISALVVIAPFLGCSGNRPMDKDTQPRHLVILGDPHLPGKNLPLKEQVLETINAWEDVDLVVAVGDICEDYGTEAEYAAAQAFFAKLRKPFLAIPGNHDYIFATPVGSYGGYPTASPAEQQAKLRTFQQTFDRDSLWLSTQVGGYRLLLLATDHHGFGTGMSDRQLDWLRGQLYRHRTTPTIIFFHGPLKGTQHAFKHYVNKPNAIAQPAEILHTIITANPQIFLWVSGHTHTPPTEVSYAAPINLYANQVTNIHNMDMKRETIWTNSLLLYPDRVVVKTYRHSDGVWLPELERTIRPPRL